MTTTAAMAASLKILTAALDDPSADIAHSVQQLAIETAGAIPTYLGLTVSVPQGGLPLTITSLAAGVGDGDISTSLRVLLPTTGAGDGHPVAVILYAAAPGAFVDLAADLAWLTGRPTTDFTLDQHLTITPGPDTVGQLQAVSDINQAIGVLIGRGYTPEQADWQLDTQATTSRINRHSAARVRVDTDTWPHFKSCTAPAPRHSCRQHLHGARRCGRYHRRDPVLQAHGIRSMAVATRPLRGNRVPGLALLPQPSDDGSCNSQRPASKSGDTRVVEPGAVPAPRSTSTDSRRWVELGATAC